MQHYVSSHVNCILFLTGKLREKEAGKRHAVGKDRDWKDETFSHSLLPLNR